MRGHRHNLARLWLWVHLWAIPARADNVNVGASTSPSRPQAASTQPVESDLSTSGSCTGGDCARRSARTADSLPSSVARDGMSPRHRPRPVSQRRLRPRRIRKALQQQSNLLIRLEQLTAKLVNLRDERDDLRHQRERAASQSRELNRQARALERRLGERRQHLKHGARRLYKLSRGGFVRLLLSSSDGEQAFRRMSGMRLLLDRDAREMRLYGKELSKLRTQRRELQQNRTAKIRLEAALTAQMSSLMKAQSQLERVLNRLRRSARMQESLQQEIDSQDHRLRRRIRALTYRVRVAGGFRARKGKLSPPVGGPVVGVFGRAIDSRRKLTLLRRGITFKPFRNARVRAVYPGAVRLVGQIPGYGNVILVEHGHDYFTLYGFLGSTDVREDDRVKIGTTLGRAGVDPLTGRVALYFEIRRKDRPLDPAPWLRRAVIRPTRDRRQGTAR